MTLAVILLDIAHQAGLTVPGMIDHKLCIDTEHLVQQILWRVSYVTHGEDSIPT